MKTVRFSPALRALGTPFRFGFVVFGAVALAIILAFVFLPMRLAFELEPSDWGHEIGTVVRSYFGALAKVSVIPPAEIQIP